MSLTDVKNVLIIAQRYGHPEQYATFFPKKRVKYKRLTKFASKERKETGT